MAALEEIKPTNRPNIRVEIKNNIVENMDVDEAKSEEEEGEINDDEDVPMEAPAAKKPIFQRIWPDPAKDTFTTGINVFNKEEQEKRLERAKRFALKPDEIRNFSDEDLKFLHETLGITESNQSLDITDVRFDAIHMLYTDSMSTEDILQYFSKYAPSGIEWIDNKSCNVIWLETISAARALHSVSKVIRGMPVRAPCDPFAKDFLDADDKDADQEETDRSVLLRNKDREIELVSEPKTREVELQHEDPRPRINTSNSVDVSDITVPIPPGYWRLGEGHPKSKCILLRFALKTDKQAYKVESFSKYYKKIGSTKIPPMDPRKSRTRGIFERNRELHHAPDKNPWGALAENWDEDAKFRERERVDINNKIEISNPSIRRRLGTKRQRESSESDVEIVEDEKPGRKKVKLPRMRMYADDEEEKIKRKKLLQTLKLQAEKISRQTVDNSDLRSILALTNRQAVIEEPDEPENQTDLGFNLNNRSRRMIFTVQRTIDDNKSKKHHSRTHEVREHTPSPHRHRRSSHRSHPYGGMHADREESIERERRKRMHEHSRRHRSRSNHDRRHHSSRLHSERSRIERRRDDYYPEEPIGKPKSKVAVVIKTQKAPAVASKVWSRIGGHKNASRSENVSEESESESDEAEEEEDESESESESESSESSSSSSASSSDSEESSSDGEDRTTRRRPIERPGFDKNGPEKLVLKTERRSPLKIEISNDHFKRR